MPKCRGQITKNVQKIGSCTIHPPEWRFLPFVQFPYKNEALSPSDSWLAERRSEDSPGFPIRSKRLSPTAGRPPPSPESVTIKYGSRISSSRQQVNLGKNKSPCLISVENPRFLSATARFVSCMGSRNPAAHRPASELHRPKASSKRWFRKRASQC